MFARIESDVLLLEIKQAGSAILLPFLCNTARSHPLALITRFHSRESLYSSC